MTKSSSTKEDLYDSFSSTEETARTIDVYGDDHSRPESWRSSDRGGSTGVVSVSFSDDEPVVIREANDYNIFGIYRKSDRWYGHRELCGFWEDAGRAMSVRNSHRRMVGKEIDDARGLEGGLVCSTASRVASLTAVLTVQRMQTKMGVPDPVAIAAAYGKFSIHAQASACKRASRYRRASCSGDALESSSCHAAKHLAGQFRDGIARLLVHKDKSHISTSGLQHRFKRLSVHQRRLTKACGYTNASPITLGH